MYDGIMKKECYPLCNDKRFDQLTRYFDFILTHWPNNKFSISLKKEIISYTKLGNLFYNNEKEE